MKEELNGFSNAENDCLDKKKFRNKTFGLKVFDEK